MMNISSEVTRELPEWAAVRTFAEGEPILSAYECALLERVTDTAFIYTLVNLRNGKTAVLSKRKTPLMTSGVNAMVERIRNSAIAGASRVQADRQSDNPISYAQAVEVLNAVFRKILPKYGYAVREEQIALATHILEAIYRGGTDLAESEVGTGKTLAYLVPMIIAKRGHLNRERNWSLYPDMAYADMSKMPVVVATSSIALQKAIITEYIPELSRILLENGVITTPISAIIRQGRERYVCRHNLSAQINLHGNSQTGQTLKKLLLRGAEIDLAEISELDARVRKHISVPGRCLDSCKHRDDCPYLEFREKAQSYDIDVQVCNHNYLLADTLRRADIGTGLIPNYQSLVIDEAHKFVAGAARSMYSSNLYRQSAGEILKDVGKIVFKKSGYEKASRRAAKKLSDVNTRLFDYLANNAKRLSDENGDINLAADIDGAAAHYLKNIVRIAEQLILLLRDEAVRVKAVELLSWVRKKYNADTNDIDLKRLLYANADEPTTREEQENRVRLQVNQLYKALCALPNVKQSAELERRQRQTRHYSYNPERQLLADERSATFDSVWRQTQKLCNLNGAYGEASEYLIRLIWRLQELRNEAEAFSNPADLICWLETEDEYKLCAVPKNLDERLYADQWRKGIPTILTSGTLSSGSRDFTRTKRTMGVERLGKRLTETSIASPFDYRKNTLLYLSKNVPFPNPESPAPYIRAVTDEIERLVTASHGRAAVLFTSYDVMGRVHAELQKKRLSYPMWKLERGSSAAIEQFKASGKGVLLASGSLWEGIDIPGDALSMLIIVKLPFQAPNALSQNERARYADSRDYLNEVLLPDMLIKLRQGAGRLIRTEKDTGVIAILDCRANERGAYFLPVTAALPDCERTSDIGDIDPFLRERKPAGYFEEQTGAFPDLGKAPQGRIGYAR